MEIGEFLSSQQRLVDAALDRLTPPESADPATIHRAMRYSLFAERKADSGPFCAFSRRRGERYELESLPGAMNAACALEMIHTYSLIHDDLHALDNDDFRRGKPTCHKVFGDAMAILAGDSLFTLATQTLTIAEDLDSERRLALIRELSFASGTVEGMIGGQVIDIESEGASPDADLLNRIHHAKTGALLKASVRMGGICGGAEGTDLIALSGYGEHVGLAFQIVDDILDVEESSAALGKTAGKDAAQGKITFPAVYGLETSRRMAAEECCAARTSLERFGERAERLREIADLIVSRKS